MVTKSPISAALAKSWGRFLVEIPSNCERLIGGWYIFVEAKNQDCTAVIVMVKEDRLVIYAMVKAYCK